MNFNKSFIDRFFRPVDNMVWDLMSGRIGFKNGTSIMTIELGDLNDDKTEAENAVVSENPFDDFGMPIPAFAQSIPVDTITLGDMIYSANKVMGWVVKKNAKSFKIMKPDGSRTYWVPPKVQMIGFDSGVMVLRSLMNMLPGGEAGLGSMQGMLMPMMAMGMLNGDDSGSGMDMKAMLPMILMSQTGAGGTGGSSMTSMLPMMMMMGMMGNNKNNSNPSKFFK
jgi:hypothetical protein